ncbi:MAG TPA: hypothetical protein DCZ95_01875 [Verrucomicrobia bacterium]|nr:hypothetical protein [Verrucomicrobiota bacterium]
MQERGVSRSDLARDLNVSPAYITKVLRGDENFSIQTLARIAFVLKMKWECLLIDRDAFLGPYCLMNETKPKMTAIETTTIETSSSISLNNEDYEVMKENHDPIPA